MNLSWALTYHTVILKYETTVKVYQNHLALAAEIFESAVYVLKLKMKKKIIKNSNGFDRLEGLFGPFIMFLKVLWSNCFLPVC